MFSKSCEYAIRAVIYLCSEEQMGRIIKVQHISIAIDAPAFYTSKILQQLSRMDFIGSMKGPNGGFYIDKKHKKNIKLIDIVTAIDGDKIFNGCGLGLKECSEKKPCPIHFRFKEIRMLIKNMLAHTTIEQLSNKNLHLNNNEILKKYLST